MNVELHVEAEPELDSLPANERFAMENALEKLELQGDTLPYPHSSKVVGAENLRELRPRSGRSPWRAFYRRMGSGIIVASIGPEAQSDPRGFRRAIAAAEARLASTENKRGKP